MGEHRVALTQMIHRPRLGRDVIPDCEQIVLKVRGAMLGFRLPGLGVPGCGGEPQLRRPQIPPSTNYPRPSPPPCNAPGRMLCSPPMSSFGQHLHSPPPRVVGRFLAPSLPVPRQVGRSRSAPVAATGNTSSGSSWIVTLGQTARAISHRWR